MPRNLLLAIAILTLSVAPAAAGEPVAPTLDLLSDHLDLSALTGKVVYVDFWASWCTPCLKSFPWMESLREAHADEGLVILAVNLDQEDTAADRFLDSHPVGFTVLRDPGDELAKAFDVRAMPTAFVFDREGRFVARHEGFRADHADGIEAGLVELLDAGGAR